MSEFKVPVVKLKIEPHPSADVLELARVDGYTSCVKKGEFISGDVAVYIPQQAIVPEPILRYLGLEGKLAGENKNRVKPIKLRGVFSEGIIYPTILDGFGKSMLNIPQEDGTFSQVYVEEGQDVAELLGITKYQPPIPTAMMGQVWGAGLDRTLRYDIENIKNYPDVFKEHENVVFTSKLHGTLVLMGYMPDGTIIISSKGLASQGIAFKLNEENQNNLYIRAFKQYQIQEKFETCLRKDRKEPFFILGEIFGKGVQKGFDYGYDATADFIGFRVFDIYTGEPGKGNYLNHKVLNYFCDLLELDRVPVVYEGPYSKDLVSEYTSGKENISGEQRHMQEGIVIRPIKERTDTKLGRVILKSISEEYLLRSGDTTEYN